MRSARLIATALALATLLACGGAPPPPPAPPPEPEDHEPPDDPTPAPTASIDPSERSRPPSTASYEDAVSTPEPVDIHDDRAQLTDGQLTGPMRGVLSGCRVPSNAKVTIKTAVQNGRAIGVTVTVAFERPPSKKPPSRYALKAEAKTAAKIVKCADRAVRAVSWPPSRRRDSFTTVF